MRKSMPPVQAWEPEKEKPEQAAALWALWAEQTRRYTRGESSSVSVECAQRLLESICFTMSLAEKPEGSSVDALWEAGGRALAKEIAVGKKLAQWAHASAPPFHNRAYWETLAGIDFFFQWYDHRFFAHEIPGHMMDYPLLSPLPDNLHGVLWINEYLRRLIIENALCAGYGERQLEGLYRAIFPEHVELIFNLYEPVAANAIGRSLAGYPSEPLAISQELLESLEARFRELTQEEIAQEVLEAAERVHTERKIRVRGSRAYLKKAAEGLLPRLFAALPEGGLGGVFLVFDPEEDEG